MKKVLVLLSILLMFSFASALPWAQRYDTWQTFAATSIEVDETLIFAVEWGEGGWDADGSKLGYGTSTDGSGWTWVNIDWVEDGDGTNKRCSTTVTFDSPGTFYYVFRMDKSGTSYANGHNGWSENSATITDKISTEFFKVTVSDPEVPVTLASFTAEAMKGKVVLDWVTESEAENSHFLIYRDGEVIGQIEGAGTTTETHVYSYVDDKVVPGVHEYMLADVTYGGVEEVHESVTVEVMATVVEANFAINKAYPNPFNPNVTVDYYMARRLLVDFGVYNMQGERIATLFNGEHEAGSHSMIWNASDSPSGIYFVRMIVGDMIQTQKVVLMK